MEEKKAFVPVEVEEYADLIEAKTQLVTLLDAIIETAALDYTKENLRYDDEIITLFMKLYNRGAYWSKVTNLKQKAEVE